MRQRIRVGRALGVEVFVDWSFVLTFALAAWTLSSIGGRLLPHLSPARLVIAAIAAAAGMFGALVLHEIAHGFVLRLCGVPVGRVTLFLLGGITDEERDPASVRSEIVAATVAPLSSALLGVLLVLAVAIAGGPMPRDLGDLDRLGAPGVVALGIAAACFAIAAINALPAYPLDGGRVLRALLWYATKDVERATRWSAWGGQMIGWLFVVFGVAIVFGARGVGVALGMWMAFSGWFIASAAAQGYESVLGVDVLGDLKVSQLMKKSFLAIPADTSLLSATRTWLECGGDRPLPVVDGERMIGFLDPTTKAKVKLAGEAVTPAVVVAPDERVARRLADLADHARLAVVVGDRLVGVLDRDDVNQCIEARGTKPARAPGIFTRALRRS